jgi:CheY-like chemotaxis protein
VKKLFEKDLGQSTAAQLAYLFPASFLRRCVGQTADVRELFSLCAQYRGGNEEALMEKLAARLRVPFSREISPLADETEAEVAARFYSRGGIPVLLDGQIIGTFCIDPSKIQDLMPVHTRHNVTIAPWSAIKSTYGQYLARTAAPKYSDMQTQESDALEYVIQEALYHNARFVDFALDGEAGWYTFSTASGEDGNSSLSATHTKQVRTFLESQWHRGNIETSFGLVSVTKQGPNHFHIEIPPPPVCTETISESPYILFIEDNAQFASIVVMFLEKAGFDVIHKSSLEHAYSVPKDRGMPCLIISDLYIGRSNHIETLQALFSSGSFDAIPIIILSSEDNLEVEIEAVALGAKVFLSKQRDPRILLAYVKQFVQRHSKIT